MFYERLYYDIAILSCGKDGICGCKDKDELKKIEKRWAGIE